MIVYLLCSKRERRLEEAEKGVSAGTVPLASSGVEGGEGGSDRGWGSAEDQDWDGR